MDQYYSTLGRIFHFRFNYWIEGGEDYRISHFYLLTAIDFDHNYGFWMYYFMPITSQFNNNVTQEQIINRPAVLNNNPRRYPRSYISFNRVIVIPFHLLWNVTAKNDFLNEIELINVINRSDAICFSNRFDIFYLFEQHWFNITRN
jgi:hypothetical protein